MCLTPRTPASYKLRVGFPDWKGFTKALPEGVQELIDYHTFGKQAEEAKKDLITDFNAYYRYMVSWGYEWPERWMGVKKPDWTTAFAYDKKVTYHKHQRTTLVRLVRKAIGEWEQTDLGNRLYTTTKTNEHGYEYIDSIYDEQENDIYEYGEGEEQLPSVLKFECSPDGLCEYMEEVWDRYWMEEFHGGMR
jgi:hypothetical protein